MPLPPPPPPYMSLPRSADTNSIPRNEFTVAEAAREAGLATFHSGKWHVGAMSARVQNTALCGCNSSKAINLPGHECVNPTFACFPSPQQNGLKRF